MNQTVIVPPGAGSRRLDVFLAEYLSASRSQVQRWLKAGYVTLDGRPVRANYQPLAGDQLNLLIPELPTVSLPPPDLPVLYEDDDVIVVDKPAGLSVHPGAGLAPEATVADWARSHTSDPDPDRPGIVHRLDRDTSGLLVIAKHPAAKHWLQQQWQQQAVKKTYVLLAIGRVAPDQAIIRLPLDRDPANALRRRVMPGGRPATTRYRTVQHYPGYTYIEAFPQTGRTHQLRVHFAATGHPIAGDVLYGPADRPAGLERQFLHAAGLDLPLPTGQRLHLTSPLPPDLTSFLSRLGQPYNR